MNHTVTIKWMCVNKSMDVLTEIIDLPEDAAAFGTHPGPFRTFDPVVHLS
ncbi:MAG: hypothetical protein KKD56_08305 [Acidobacteria bacterium]|nr:hypothetical protein [Acidobacteriota bacterium]MBU4253162.1 hypothetical protein [Acidobacteriota bacterium]MBU4329735.1 hypothetical protein [Acidobacteriota bacterium]MCG2814858.1 hypothetical protein [Candidatus Aminicenantes bacterium]